MKLYCSLSNPPLGGLAIVELIKDKHPCNIEWGLETSIITNTDKKQYITTPVGLLRIMARDLPNYQIYGNSVSERTQIDQWLTFSLCMTGNLKESLDKLQTSLTSITYLVGNRLTIADLAVFNELYTVYGIVEKTGIPIHVQRWYNLIRGQQCIENVLANLPADVKKLQQQKLSTDTAEANVVTSAGDRKQEGKFVDLPGAEMGKVIVRFPPEASGFLHIGHAKAALLNQYYQETFNGKLVMRFDDTNPAKETLEFELVILEDLKMLEIKPDIFTHTSDYFDIMLKYCEQLLTDGKAYVDDTEPEQMKKEREQKIEAVNRSNSVAKNFEMWKEMLNGTARGQQCCVRAKMDMSSANGCMRDPTIYRCKNEPHPRTGTKYKVYPTYDFACPIVDAIENVTHTLRTTEYHDRDDQFYWFIDNLKLRKPYIWEYSRLNMTNTVLSKRKLTWFVDQGHVDGWDDPRFPTVRGILRRGMTVAGLKEFIIAQGSSKSVVFMEWDKIWAFNKKIIDPIAPRYTALVKNHAVRVNVAGCNKREMIEVPAHPKNIDIGMKQIWIGPTILIDDVDAVQLCENENVTFINWGNLLIRKINKLANGCIDTIDAELNLSNKDFKKTLKLTWLCEMESDDDYPPTFCVYFNHIISKAILAKNEDFKDFIGHKTRSELEMLGDPELKKCKKGDIIQLQRRGFFKVDNAYAPASSNSGVASPIVLFEIPDGHTKEKQTAGKKTVVPIKENVIQQSNTSNPTNGTLDGATLNLLITKQGDIVRNLKANKATKPEIDAAVKELITLKIDYKTITGTDWKPSSSSTTSVPVQNQSASAVPTQDNNNTDANKINEDILKQGDIVRNLKTQKATKSEIDAAVKELLKLKTDYKTITGTDWKPSSVTSASAPIKSPSAVLTEAIDNSKKPSDANKINEDILKQGDIVRNLKTQKATKSEIDAAVKELLKLKTDYKTITGTDWKPSSVTSASAPIKSPSAVLTEAIDNSKKPSDANKINEDILKQGDIVRNLKTQKAIKSEIDAAVKELLKLKTDYKTITGTDWKPSSSSVTSAPVPKQTAPAIPVEAIDITKKPDNAIKINEDILKQGNIVRDLKSKKATKDEIDVAVKCLLTLKTNYKNITGLEWKPGCVPPPADSNTASVSLVSESSLSSQLKEMTPPTINSVLEDFPVPASTKTSRNKSTDNKCKEKKKEKVGNKTNELKTGIIGGTDGTTDASAVKKQTRLGLEATKEKNLPDWYSQVITKGEMIEYYDVSGCYILRHWSFAIWKFIKNWFDAEITELGVKECYFPIFVSRAALEKEKSHITDFAPEVAWVTKSGESDLAEPIAVRPTSETVMYPAYAKWIQSYRDLPLRLNQWNNVVRWEFKHPQPFLRTREFLWQEGHTAFATAKEAQDEVLQILDLYAKIYTDLLAIPVVKGRKTEKEKFAGGDFTTTVEAFVSASGRAIQGATSHYLGQNFSKMFDIVYEDPVTQEKKYVHQNSWGITTRTIGVMVMVHADNKGLVLPPRVACIQIIIVPCGIMATTSEQVKEEIYRNCKEIEIELLKNGLRTECDFRDNYSPGWKFNHWELKGVPIRIELGPKDIQLNQFIAVRRDTGEKLIIKRNEILTECVHKLLDNIHADMYQKATADLKEHTKVSKNWEEFCKFLNSKNIILSPFCGDQKCEEKIKLDSARDDVEAEPGAPAMGAKTLCIPFEQPTHLLNSDKCIHPLCLNKPNAYVLFGRSY